MNIQHTIENLKNEIKHIKFLSQREVQQITIAVIISGFIASLTFFLIDTLLNLIITMFLGF